MLPAITVQTTIQAPLEICWQTWTSPADILLFNNPFPDWHTAQVTIDCSVNGRFFYRMEAKDGSEGFDFTGVYSEVIPGQRIECTGDDGRKTINIFSSGESGTTVTETFEPDTQTPIELQRSFCQNILDSFKQYVEGKMK